MTKSQLREKKKCDFTIGRRDGNENVTNNNSFSGQNNNFARAFHFFFFAVSVRLRREIV